MLLCGETEGKDCGWSLDEAKCKFLLSSRWRKGETRAKERKNWVVGGCLGQSWSWWMGEGVVTRLGLSDHQPVNKLPGWESTARAPWKAGWGNVLTWVLPWTPNPPCVRAWKWLTGILTSVSCDAWQFVWGSDWCGLQETEGCGPGARGPLTPAVLPQHCQALANARGISCTHPWLAGLLVGCPGFPQVPGKGECLWWQPAPGGLMGSGALWESPKKDFFVTVVKWQIQLMSGACRVADNSNIMVYTHVSTPKKHWYFLPARYSSYLGRVVLPIYPKHSKVTIQTDRNDAGLKKRVWNNILQAQHSPPDIWAFNTPMGLYFQVFSVVMTYFKMKLVKEKGQHKELTTHRWHASGVRHCLGAGNKCLPPIKTGLREDKRGLVWLNSRVWDALRAGGNPL